MKLGEGNWPEKAAKKDWILLCGVQACYWLTMTLHSSFLVFYLNQKHYNTTVIAGITLSMTIINLFVQPLWGYVADAFLGIKRVLIVCFLGSIPTLLLLPVMVRFVWVTIILNFVYAVFNYPLQGLTDSITNIAATRNKFVVFGFTRGCGSIAASVGSLMIGFVLDFTATEMLFLIEALLLLLAAVFLLKYKNVPYGMKQKMAGSAPEATDVGRAVAQLVKNPIYLLTLFSITLMNTGNRTTSFFVPILIDEYGGNNFHMGIALFLMCLLMAPCMVIHSRMLQKGIGNYMPLLMGAMLGVFRVGLLYFARTLHVLIGLQILQSFAYGFLQPSTVAAASEASAIQVRSTAISLAIAVTTVLGTLIGQIGGSVVSEYIGIHRTFLVSAAVTFIGILFYLPVMWHVRRPRAIS